MKAQNIVFKDVNRNWHLLGDSERSNPYAVRNHFDEVTSALLDSIVFSLFKIGIGLAIGNSAVDI